MLRRTNPGYCVKGHLLINRKGEPDPSRYKCLTCENIRCERYKARKREHPENYSTREHIPITPEEWYAYLRDRVSLDDNGCWEWQLHIGKDGYARARRNERSYLLHRVSYELFNGAIPDGLYIDHLCSNKSCINPDHLEPVTPAENTFRCKTSIASVNLSKTHCPQGHEYTEANTKITKGGRRCRRCLAASHRRRLERNYQMRMLLFEEA